MDVIHFSNYPSMNSIRSFVIKIFGITLSNFNQAVPRSAKLRSDVRLSYAEDQNPRFTPRGFWMWSRFLN